MRVECRAMPRIARWLLNTLTLASLLLCVALAGLWVRSYWVADRIHWANAGGWRAAGSAQGSAEVSFLLTDWSSYPAEFHGPRYQRDVARTPFNWIRLMGGSS